MILFQNFPEKIEINLGGIKKIKNFGLRKIFAKKRVKIK